MRGWLGVLGLLLLAMPASADCREGYRVPLIPLGYASGADKQGEPSGFYVDLLREVANRSGCRLLLEILPAARARALREVRPSPIMAPTGASSAEANPALLFIPMAREPMDLIIREDLPIEGWRQAEEDRKLVFGSIRGASYGEWVNRFLRDLPAGRHDVSIDAETVYRKLGAGRIGATFGNAYVYRWYMDRGQLQGQVRVLPVPAMRRVVVGVMLDTTALAPQDISLLKQTVEAVRDDGSFRRMMARYLGEELARERAYASPPGPLAP
ncbi:ABC transporter substrate-binding protein [Chitinimonas sp.]|uniref:substrate-binding periplasmic protein n=1 Tax=Chitinimonas sp. TaxID=1934313 RepID=UPI002F9270BA